MLLADDGQLERRLGVFQRPLDRQVDDKSEQDGTKDRTHDQGRTQCAPVAEVVENLLEKHGEHCAHYSGPTMCMALTNASSMSSQPGAFADAVDRVVDRHAGRER